MNTVWLSVGGKLFASTVVSRLHWPAFTAYDAHYTIPPQKMKARIGSSYSRLPWKRVHRHAYTLPQVTQTCGRSNLQVGGDRCVARE